jgi:hypothetical protein
MKYIQTNTQINTYNQMHTIKYLQTLINASECPSHSYQRREAPGELCSCLSTSAG